MAAMALLGTSNIYLSLPHRVKSNEQSIQELRQSLKGLNSIPSKMETLSTQVAALQSRYDRFIDRYNSNRSHDNRLLGELVAKIENLEQNLSNLVDRFERRKNDATGDYYNGPRIFDRSDGGVPESPNDN